jgi:ribonuclease Z
MKRRSKWMVAGLAVLLVIGGAIKAFQPQIAMALLKRVIAERAGRDVTAGLPDGFHVGLCGTGSPLPSRDRAGACTFIIAGKHIFVVDTGEGAARNIGLMGVPMGRVEGIFLTHFHSDHIDGMGPVLLMRWTGGAATSPLPVHGPTGVERVVAGFNAAYALDDGYRTAHHGPAIAPPSGAGGVAVPFALPATDKGDSLVVLETDGLKVTAFRVNHGPVEPAVGYRFDYKGRSVVVSGDTAQSASLIAAAKGADLLVHEALAPNMVKEMTVALNAKGLKNMAQITRDILNYHSSPETAADAAKAAGVRQLVLSHIVPPIPSRFFYPAFLGDAAKHYGGPITVGEDGMMFSLPAGGSTISQTTAF